MNPTLIEVTTVKGEVLVVPLSRCVFSVAGKEYVTDKNRTALNVIYEYDNKRYFLTESLLEIEEKIISAGKDNAVIAR